MHPTIFHFLRAFIADYGYWAVALALLCESAGVPVPGEITLLLVSFLAYHEHQLHLGWVIMIATCAATLGGDLGYALGYYGGRALLDRYQSVFRIPAATIKRGEEIFARYGAAAIFFARFVFGLRVFAGPLAGVLRMRWRAFALFNFLGAAVWVTCIASVRQQGCAYSLSRSTGRSLGRRSAALAASASICDCQIGRAHV